MSSTSTNSKQSGGIMSVGEMIDSTFGDRETNTVNHKLMQTVLFLLARQLRILDRKVAIELPGTYRLASNTSSISITEVKIHSMTKKKKKQSKTADDAEKSKGGVSVAGGFGTGTITVAFGTTSGGGFKGGAPSDDTSKASKKTTTSSVKKPTPTDKRSAASTKSSSVASSKKTASMNTTSTGRGLSAYAKILDEVEQQREEELRVIRQRVDSREDQEKTPSPMASLDSVEATYEKLLIVERVPSDQAKIRGKGTPQLSVVTQEQFNELRKKVEKLQEKFGPFGSASFPENVKLMQELRRGSSLTDAMAALQLSARLEATEKTMEQMIALVTALASKTPGVEQGIEELFGEAKEPIKKDVKIKKRKTAEGSQESTVGGISLKTPTSVGKDDSGSPDVEIDIQADGSEKAKDFITYEELEDALQGLSAEIAKMVEQLLSKANMTAEGAIKLATVLERKLEPSLNMGTRMDHLEALVAEYSLKINTFDTNLTSQMTNYQEELTQMQHDLETALETMADNMANSGGDAVAVAEMNTHFNNLQTDIDDTITRQKDLQNLQNVLAVDLENLRKEIEILREVKSDRDEVADALRDKVGIGELNSMVSIEQFEAIRADFEKRVLGAYDKFNSQETLWQKAIDEIVRELNEKADIIQVESLHEDINDHLEVIRKRLHAMLEIVGEPKSAALTRQIHRDAACLSCATPAIMELEENKVPVLPKARAPGGSEHIRKEGGDYKPCYPGLPIPHPIDPRAQFCKRWCGGSHTAATLPRLPPDTILTQPLLRNSTLGNYGNADMSDEIKPADILTKPKEDASPEITPKDFASTQGKEDAKPPPRSDMTPSDYASTQGVVYATPPASSGMAQSGFESTEGKDSAPPFLPGMPLPDLESTQEKIDVTPPLPRDEE